MGARLIHALSALQVRDKTGIHHHNLNLDGFKRYQALFNRFFHGNRHYNALIIAVDEVICERDCAPFSNSIEFHHVSTFWLRQIPSPAGSLRVPERALLGLSLCSGGIGALAGMLLFRHKTRKNLFWFAAIGGIVVLICLLFFWKG